jgi:Flp pilus assembly protein TadD
MRQALALEGSMAVIANNLAFLLAQEEEGDLGAALEMVNQAIQAEPENADFLDTRGAIHRKMGNLAEAAVDYERALEKSGDPSPIQASLAEVYETMGDKATAKRFREATAGGSL